MADRTRRESRQEEAEPKPRSVPQLGRDYVLLINRRSWFVQKVLHGEWVRMQQGEGDAEWGECRCATCKGVVVKRCVYVDTVTGWARFVDFCGCCPLDQKQETKELGAPVPETSPEPPTESAEVSA